jgi:DNA-binding CsgD family transcriptional regulator
MYSLCTRWQKILDRQLVDAQLSNGTEQLTEIYHSGRRRYSIEAIGLSNPLTKNKYTLFILRRLHDSITVDLRNFSTKWKLNRREIEILNHLLADKSNKEIAQALGLSINTIKGYLRFLMRRLGVGSRSGVISCLLTRKVSL